METLNCVTDLFSGENKKFKEDYKYSFATRRYSLTLDDLQNIDISTVKDKGPQTIFKSDFLDNRFVAFKENQTDVSEEGVKSGIGGIELITDDSNVRYIVEDKLAMIKEIKSLDDIYKTIHELGHLVLNYSKTSDLREKVFEEINGIINFLRENKDELGIDIQVQLTKEGETEPKLYNLSELTIGDLSEIEKEELINSFLSTLISNDFIKSNNKVIAKLFNPDKTIANIGDTIQGFTIIGSPNNNHLTTISQLFAMMREYGYHRKNMYVERFTQNIYGLLNSSPQLKEAFFGSKGETKSKANDFDVLNEIEKKVSVLRDGTQKLHKGFFNNVGLGDLLDISKDKMILNKALALAKGGMNLALEHAQANKEFIERMIADISPDLDRETVDNVYGHMIVFGFNFLNQDLVSLDKASISDVFHTLTDIDSQRLINIFDREPERAKELLDAHYLEIFAEIEDKFGPEISHKFNEHAKNASLGSMKDLNELTKLIANINRTDGYEITNKTAQNIAKKIVSLYAIKERIIDKKYFNQIFKTFNSIYSKEIEKSNKLFQAFNSKLNNNGLFGDNIELKFLEESKGLQITDNPEGIDKDNIIAKINVKGKEYYAFVGDRYNTKIGDQDALVLPFNLREFEKGIYERNIDGVNIVLNAQNMKLKRGFIDKKLSTQFRRNAYIEAKKEIAKDLGYRQWKILRDNNILLTKSEVDQLVRDFGHDRDRYVMLPKDNPLVQLSGGIQWYIDGRYAHQLIGTKGIELKNMYKGFMNEKQAKTLALYTKSVLDLFREASKALLFITPKVLINNYLTSLGIYIAHSSDRGALFVKYNRMAKKLYKQYKEDLKQYVIAKNELDTIQDEDRRKIIEEEINRLEESMKNNPIHYAFENGFTDTLRSTALQINAVEDLTVYQLIKNKFGKHQAEIARYVFMNENNTLGKKMGDIFEAGELFPKLALYLERLDKYKNQEEALMYTLHAFPRYFNLPLSLQLLDHVSPYTKFFVNIPRLALFAFINNPSRFATLYALSYAMPTIMDENQQDSWYAENGYIDIGDWGNENIYLSQVALDPILHPLSSLGYKPTIFDIPHWFLKDVSEVSEGPKGWMQYMLPVNIGR